MGYDRGRMEVGGGILSGRKEGRRELEDEGMRDEVEYGVKVR